MLARSILFMQPREGCREELVNTFERLDVTGQALRQEGCLSVELQVPTDGDAPVLVTALWTRRTAYDGWLDNPWREQSSEELFALLTQPPEGVVYAIRVAAGNPVVAGEDAV